MRYERIRSQGKTIYLTDIKAIVILGQDCIQGSQIDREGEFVTDAQGAFVNHIIALGLITKRTEVFYNNKYGILEN